MLLVDLVTEVAVEQRRETERLVAEELRADHRVDQIRDREAEVAVEDAQVVVGAVQDLRDAAIRQNLAELRQIELTQRIDDQVLARNRHLDEAHLVEVRMQRISLGVERDDRLRGNAGHGGIESLLGVDEDHSTRSRSPIETSLSLNARRSNCSVAARTRTSSCSSDMLSRSATSSAAGTRISRL